MKFGGWPKNGSVEVLGSCGLTVHKSINAYPSLSHTFESVILSSSSICSVGLSKVFSYSHFS